MPGTPGGMENAHETLAVVCTGVETRFPHRLGRHRTPPTRSTGKIVVLFEHDVTGRTRAPVAKPMGGNRPTNVAALRRAFTFAGIRVHVPRIRRSTSPECAVTVGEAIDRSVHRTSESQSATRTDHETGTLRSSGLRGVRSAVRAHAGDRAEVARADPIPALTCECDLRYIPIVERWEQKAALTCSRAPWIY